MHGANEAAPLLYEYSAKKILSSMGYKFDSHDLTDFDVDVFTLIESEIKRLDRETPKKRRR